MYNALLNMALLAGVAVTGVVCDVIYSTVKKHHREAAAASTSSSAERPSTVHAPMH
jgi:hypothetical protein